MRTGNRGLNNLEMTEEDFFDIKVQGVVGSVENYQKIDRPYDGETVETMNAWLDEAVSENKWLVEMWHSVCWEGIGDDGKPAYLSDGGYRPIRANIGEAHMAYAGKLQEEGKIWVAPMGEAMKYIRERQSSTLIDTATRTSRVISLTHDLDKKYFSDPLTLKSRSTSYVGVRKSGAKRQHTEHYSARGKRQILYYVRRNPELWRYCNIPD